MAEWVARQGRGRELVNRGRLDPPFHSRERIAVQERLGSQDLHPRRRRCRRRKAGNVAPVDNNDDKLARLLAAQLLPTVKVVTTKDDAGAKVRRQEPNIEALPGENGAEV